SDGAVISAISTNDERSGNPLLQRIDQYDHAIVARSAILRCVDDAAHAFGPKSWPADDGTNGASYTFTIALQRKRDDRMAAGERFDRSHLSLFCVGICFVYAEGDKKLVKK